MKHKKSSKNKANHEKFSLLDILFDFLGELVFLVFKWIGRMIAGLFKSWF
ncbi:hypothetical protein [Virgibacillus pantothenticus]|nr:hypothetical protein [Virgibacillus pantothenticus]GIP63812.1 hypothetical protein J32TS6_23670 [Virgibacillus pantothenticus]SIS71393.1 hypothetical protein SAMN05421787_102336 [Virgibacillus pantothenticus]